LKSAHASIISNIFRVVGRCLIKPVKNFLGFALL
jgi:hypothetical protein